MRNYYGSNLTTSITSKISECDGKKLNWDAVEIEFYNQFIKDRESMFNQKICWKEIVNTSIDLFTCCSNKSCCQKVVIVPGEKLVHSINCRRRMKPTFCNYTFECTLEFESISLAAPESVLSAFLREDVISVCQQNINNLYEKILYLENIDLEFNPTKNTVTKIYYHQENV